jgi:hypothetical protein
MSGSQSRVSIPNISIPNRSSHNKKKPRKRTKIRETKTPECIVEDILQIEEHTIESILEPIPESKIKSPEVDHSGNLAKILSQNLIRHQQNNLSDEFDRWAQFYNDDLETMYSTIVRPKLDIPFDKFKYVAYCCTETEYSKGQLKQVRPLI